ncbi:hypothetical protein EBZ80_02040 [bacterium]|nr:hypothetical protein [bacterium]
MIQGTPGCSFLFPEKKNWSGVCAGKNEPPGRRAARLEMSDLWHRLECECNPGFRYATLTTFDRHFASRRHQYHELVMLRRQDDIEKRRAHNKIRVLENKIRENEHEKEELLCQSRQAAERLSDEHREATEQLIRQHRQDNDRLSDEHRIATERLNVENSRVQHQRRLGELRRSARLHEKNRYYLRLLNEQC